MLPLRLKCARITYALNASELSMQRLLVGFLYQIALPVNRLPRSARSCVGGWQCSQDRNNQWFTINSRQLQSTGYETLDISMTLDAILSHSSKHRVDST
jgi:hypothetical protein